MVEKSVFTQRRKDAKKKILAILHDIKLETIFSKRMMHDGWVRYTGTVFTFVGSVAGDSVGVDDFCAGGFGAAGEDEGAKVVVADCDFVFQHDWADCLFVGRAG
jgi:hypothetical protein